MQAKNASAATIFKPHQGKTFSFFGNTVTCKFSGHGENSRFFELMGTASSGIPSLHTHPWDEWFYFLEGNVTIQVGDQTMQATPGYAVSLPAGVPHTFAINSPHAKFLVWVSQAAAEHYLEELAEAAQQRALTPEDVLAIGLKHHIQPVFS